MRIKNFFFFGILCPNSLFIAALFWSVYWIDRELCYIKEFDTYIPFWHNHVGHTLILIPIIVEFFDKDGVDGYPKYTTACVLLNALNGLYHIEFVFERF